MRYDFLRQFDKRMKGVGQYALLYKNSSQKGTWKQYGFNDFDEQVNMIFSVLLFIMEQTLKYEPCTMDDIKDFIDQVNIDYFQHEIAYEGAGELAEFIVNVILCDEGKPMYFKGYSYESSEYKSIHISYVANKIVYIDNIRRTSYYITDMGYNLLFGTLEIEANMKLNLQEMIFREHLKKASYDKAVDDVKGIFAQIRGQIQKIEDAMKRIRQNALNYSADEYRQIKEETLDYIKNTKERFEEHRLHVKECINDIRARSINVNNLDKKDTDNLKYLAVIEDYLGMVIDAHQSIFTSYYQLSELYAKELEDMSRMTIMKRFNFRSEFYNKVLDDPSALVNIDIFMRPLFNKHIHKSYEINKCLELPASKASKKKEEEEILDIADSDWQEEMNRLHHEKMMKYKASLKQLLLFAVRGNGQQITLHEIRDKLNIEKEKKSALIPTMEIFKEIIVELLGSQTIDVLELRKEQVKSTEDETKQFQVKVCLLELLEETPELYHISKVDIYKVEGGQIISFDNVLTSIGTEMRINCSDFSIQLG